MLALSNKFSVLAWLGAIALAFLSAPGVGTAKASSYRTLYGFNAPFDGVNPETGLVIDALGRLYGSTNTGGAGGAGVVYRLNPPSNGSKLWSEEILYAFHGSDGSGPLGLLLGRSGELYGMTNSGGAENLGTVFRLDFSGSQWVLTMLHTFSNQASGSYPSAGLVFGPSGLLYGSTALGGPNGHGTVFSISPQGDSVEFASIYQFGDGSAGSTPVDALLPVGNGLLGTTAGGFPGAVAFRLSPASTGGWTYHVVHTFGLAGDFNIPSSSLIKAGNGAFYGCASGGPLGKGGIYALTHTPPDVWTETVLYSFGSSSTDPDASGCGVTLSPTGQIIGTSLYGGAYGDGTVFSLTLPASAGQPWSLTVLHNFLSKSSNGADPIGPLVRKGGQYYGNTNQTMAVAPYGPGVVFRITP